jgi:menaquinone-dependent protoporphyrinogen oxidase
MKFLIAVTSKYGSTREIADEIAKTLQNEGFTVDICGAGDVSGVSGYDGVILGNAVYAGSWLPEARQLIERTRVQLAMLPVWVFSSGPLGGENPMPHDDPDKLAAPLDGLPVRDHHVFVGKLDFDHLKLPERLLAKAVHAPEGDFRNWDDIRGWAREIAHEFWENAKP